MEKEATFKAAELDADRSIDLKSFSRSYTPRALWKLWLALAITALLILMIIAIAVLLEFRQKND